MADLSGMIARARKSLKNVGLDLTGEGLEIPAGKMRIFDNLAGTYAAAGHTVQHTTITVNGEQKTVTLVEFGDPRRVADNILAAGDFFPKPGDHPQEA